jgi:hypothetical protein
MRGVCARFVELRKLLQQQQALLASLMSHVLL